MKRSSVWLVTVLLVGFIHLAEAQQPDNRKVIGLFRSGSASLHAAEREAFLQALKDLGYIEGTNVRIEYRYAESKPERWRALINDLVRIKVDVLITAGVVPARIAKHATSSVPIVIGTAGDLVRTGIVNSLARPGGNVTGVTEISSDSAGKRLELLTEIVLKPSRIAVIWHSQPGVSDDDHELSEIKSAADRFGVEVMSSGLRNAQDLKNAYANIATIKPNGAITPRNSVTLLNRKQLADFAVKINLPTICEGQDFVHDGCLLSYGSDCYITGGEQLRWIKSLKGPNPLIFP